MKLLNTYEDKDIAEEALKKLEGESRLASERDATETIYNLFGQATWGNFYRLGMFNLSELQQLVSLKQNAQEYDKQRHSEIMSMLTYAASIFDLTIPEHWK